MKLKIVDFETSLLARDIGFNWDCENYYDKDLRHKNGYSLCDGNMIDGYQHNDYSRAPNQEILKKWLRDEHEYWIILSPRSINQTKYKWVHNVDHNTKKFDSYEDALEDGLVQCMKILQIKLQNGKTNSY